MSILSRLAESALSARLSKLQRTRVVLREAGRSVAFGPAATPEVLIDVLDDRAYAAIAFGGAVGAGESYARGWWTTADLTMLVRVFLREREVLDGLETGGARIANLVRRAAGLLAPNTRTGSRRHIRAHYDLSDEFFGAFLDETMTYSCGLFQDPHATLREASEAKYERIATLLDVQPGDHLLEIGCGWGGFAVHVARTRGCRVTATTISARQHAVATERVRRAGLGSQVAILDHDYRDLRGRYDKVASIEMIEAVGHEQIPTFFEACARLLAPDGLAAIQSITIADERYDAARREVDFIKRYIFPGSCIPSRAVLREAAGIAGLVELQADEIGAHYAETLRRWRGNFALAREAITALGFDAQFQRLWEFYFCYCEGGFDEGAIGTAQLLFAPVGARRPRLAGVSPVPALAGEGAR